MRRVASLALGLLIVVSLARADQAPDPRAQEAKQRYESGMAHFNLQEWDAAIKEWKAGYLAKPVPQFLYNIAQAYRLSKHYEDALTFYQSYLRADPHAPNRAEVEGHIHKLATVIATEKRAESAPPTMALPVRPKGAEESAPPPSPGPRVAAMQPSPAPVAQTTPQPNALTAEKQPEKPTPITKKKWFWPVIGAGAAVVVGAIIIGAVVGTSGGGDNTKVLPLARF